MQSTEPAAKRNRSAIENPESIRASPQSAIFRYWFLLFCWAALIFVGSSFRIPHKPAVEGPLTWDKLAHAIEYAVLGALLCRAFLGGQGLEHRIAMVLAAGFSLAYGFSDEIHQFFVGRDCELGDLLADFGGAMIGCFAMARFQRNQREA